MNIRYEKVSKRFATPRGAADALRALDLEVPDGCFFIFLGPSGCGKSTLLNLTAGLEAPTTGRILFGDRVVAAPAENVFVGPAARNVAMVFQSYALYPHMTVFDNIAFPLRNARRAARDIRQAVLRVAAMLDIEHLTTRKPGELSGGQRQRVAIARALVRNPAVFLMDEPLSNLDARLRTATRAELKRLSAETAVTTLYVTHDQTEAMTLGDRVALLRQGRLVQVGTPEELYRHPVDPFAATFIGSPPMNLIPADLQTGADGLHALLPGARLALPPDLQRQAERLQSGRILIGIRPEHLRPAEKGLLTGRIVYTEYLGREVILRMDVSGRQVLALTERRDVKAGQTVSLTFDRGDLHLFAAQADDVDNL